jgi:hypothetical protein
MMAWMNGLKVGGILLLLAGAHPLLAFALVGAAASIYAPCKYGLVTECVPHQHLIRGNAWLEVTVVLSVIFGSAAGAGLVAWSKLEPLHQLHLGTGAEPLSIASHAFVLILLLYALSAVLNSRIHFLNARSRTTPLTWTGISWTQFWNAQQQLWNDPLGRISLYVTTLFWGVGAVLQFAVLIWAERHLQMPVQQGALLQALVAIGVMAGAAFAGRRYRLHSARRVIPMGFVLALLLPVVALTHSLEIAIPLLLVLGATGGMLLVPMNALLQHRGVQVLTAGRSIAVQGFNENFSVLIMLGVYSFLLYADWSIFSIMAFFSCMLLLGMMPIWRPWHRRQKRT